ncbi:hemerythrin domain-containing protein [Spirillospora sp. NPDC048911]|uniref:hemerythrin domain-containing protein n=1 Tax=Spirillospora sp. NPDC048911 TaxID=3364527 RepID=UPI00371C9F48
MTRQSDDTVVGLLLRQHTEIRDLFAQVEKSSGKSRDEAFGRLRHLLAVHETAEEEIVHPFARRTIGNGERIIDARLKEEKGAKEILQELEKSGTGSDEFDALFERLHKAVESHAEQEERLEFPELAEKATPQQLKGMRAAVKAAEAVAPTHPHPGTESATKNAALGPMAAVMDRTRDAIRKAMS